MSLPTTRAATTEEDRAVVDSFRNFLSWGVRPVNATPRDIASGDTWPRPVPPAWYAYALGVTRYCPPVGEL